MELSESLLEKMTPNQVKMLQVLADNPSGIFSRQLALQTGVSNKSAAFTKPTRELLADYGLEIYIERKESYRGQALWMLRKLPYVANPSDYLDSFC